MNYRKYKQLLKNADIIPEEIYIEMVKWDINIFCSMEKKNQTKRICLEACKQNGNAIFYTYNQTEEMCLEAVKQNGYALQYVKEQTENICIEAVKQNKGVLRFVNFKFQHLF